MPLPGEFQAVNVDYKALEEHGIVAPYYVQTVQFSVDLMQTFREFAESNREAADQFVADWEKSIDFKGKQKGNLKAKFAAMDLLRQLPSIKNTGGLYICGSTLNNCGVANCDVDICWTIPVKIVEENVIEYPMRDTGDYSTVKLLRKVEMELTNWYNITEMPEGDKVSGIELREGARVKILKFNYHSHKENTVAEIDLNINNVAGIYNTFLLRHYSKIDDRFAKLVKVLKIWGSNANVINPKERRLNSYTITLMVVHFLQSGVSPPILPNLVCMKPDLFSGSMSLKNMSACYNDDLKIEMPHNDATLFELLLGFLHYYSDFDYRKKGILLREGRVIDKPREYENVQFFIEEIYDRLTVPKNLTSALIEDIRKLFLDSFMFLVKNPVFSEWQRYEPYFNYNPGNVFEDTKYISLNNATGV